MNLQFQNYTTKNKDTNIRKNAKNLNYLSDKQ